MGVSSIRKVCVIGAGNMGSGIAQVCAQSGFAVSMVDIKDEFVQKGLAGIKNFLAEGVKKGKVKEAEMDRVVSSIKGTTDIKEAVKDAGLIIEVVFEDMEIKRKLFSEVDSLASPDAIIATNTSSLSVSELSKSTTRPEKFAGLHFFYPAAINKLVEVIAGTGTSRDSVNTLMDFSRMIGKIPIEVRDSPGFAVNRLFVPFLNEACRMLDEGIGDIPTIEDVAKKTLGIGMGQFTLMNVTGIPIAYHSQNSLYLGLGDYYKPAKNMKSQFELGKKWQMEGTPGTDETKRKVIEERFLGMVFGIACQLVDEGVASMEDTDKGCTTGLRWKAGPFALMNEAGLEKAYKLVKSYDEFTGLGMPKSLEMKKAVSGAQGWQPWTLRNVKVVKDGKIAFVFMDRAESMNALNSKVLGDLECALYELEADKSIHVIILTGEGSAFVAGADIKEMMAKTPLQAREFTAFGQRVIGKLETIDKVVIAAVNGYALGGGCELALACDMIVASDKAMLGLPEVSLGIHPGFGGTQRLPRLIGRNRAKELIFTGDMIGAKEAERIGLVNRVVPAGELLDVARKIAAKILTRGPVAVKLAKDAVNRGLEMDLNKGLAYEVECISVGFSSDDAKEGMKAFVEKRRPDFKGK
jgi:enoyl-CoA hydratase/3-hydroxyacyl-CoA dehydrogenase